MGNHEGQYLDILTAQISVEKGKFCGSFKIMFLYYNGVGEEGIM